MFKTFPDASMRQECTPANVLSAARLLSILKTVSKKDLYNYYRLGIPNNNTQFAKYSSDAICELGIAQVNDVGYRFVGNEKDLESLEVFRKFVSKFVSEHPEIGIYQFIEKMIECNEDFSINTSMDDIVVFMAKNKFDVDKNAVSCLCTWMDFLGFGVRIPGGGFIPNLATRLKDAFNTCKCEKVMNKASFKEWLYYSIPEVKKAMNINGKMLPYALSNGLRTLRSEGFIELIFTKDADRFELYPIEVYGVEEFASITIKEG